MQRVRIKWTAPARLFPIVFSLMALAVAIGFSLAQPSISMKVSYIFIAILAGGFAYLVSYFLHGGYNFQRSSELLTELLSSGKKTNGKIERISEYWPSIPRSIDIDVSFDADGNKIQNWNGRTYFWSPKFAVGQQVTILYDPKNPTKFAVVEAYRDTFEIIY